MSDKLFKLRNGTVFLLTEAPGGVYNSTQLKKLAEICNDDLAIVKVTEDQRLGLFVKEEEVPAVSSTLQECGLGVRHYQEGVHQAVACLGELCPEHDQDALGTAMELSTLMDDISVSGPLKVGINGCYKCCTPCHTLDISLIGEASGYRLSLGGRSQQLPELAAFIAEGIPPEEAPKFVSEIIKLYADLSEEGETLLDVIERTGVSSFVQALAPYSQDAAVEVDPFAGDASEPAAPSGEEVSEVIDDMDPDESSDIDVSSLSSRESEISDEVSIADDSTPEENDIDLSPDEMMDADEASCNTDELDMSELPDPGLDLDHDIDLKADAQSEVGTVDSETNIEDLDADEVFSDPEDEQLDHSAEDLEADASDLSLEVDDASDLDADLALESDESADLALESDESADLALESDESADLALESDESADLALESDESAGLALESDESADLALESDESADLALESDESADLALESDESADLALESDESADLALESDESADLALESDESADLEIGDSDLSMDLEDSSEELDADADADADLEIGDSDLSMDLEDSSEELDADADLEIGDSDLSMDLEDSSEELDADADLEIGDSDLSMDLEDSSEELDADADLEIGDSDLSMDLEDSSEELDADADADADLEIGDSDLSMDLEDSGENVAEEVSSDIEISESEIESLDDSLEHDASDESDLELVVDSEDHEISDLDVDLDLSGEDVELEVSEISEDDGMELSQGDTDVEIAEEDHELEVSEHLSEDEEEGVADRLMSDIAEEEAVLKSVHEDSQSEADRSSALELIETGLSDSNVDAGASQSQEISSLNEDDFDIDDAELDDLELDEEFEGGDLDDLSDLDEGLYGEDDIDLNSVPSLGKMDPSGSGKGNPFQFSGIDILGTDLHLSFESGAFMDFDLSTLAIGLEKHMTLGGQSFVLSRTEEGLMLEVEGVRVFYPSSNQKVS